MYNILPEETKEERWKRLNSRTATPAQQRARKAEQKRRERAEEILSDIQALGRASRGNSSSSSTTPEFNTPEAEVRKLEPGQKVDILAVRAKKAMQSEALDPVGKEDSDIDNDGRKNTKSDKYLLNRRRVRSSYINKKRVAKEEYSDWRDDLCEILHLIEREKNDKKIQEKENINNNIKICPTVSEAVDNLGGTLLEMVELDEINYIIESVYDELYNEGYYEEDIEDALEYALTEAKVTFGHDTPTGEKKKRNLIGALGRLARQKLSSAVRGAQSKKRKVVSTVARKVADKATKIANRADSNEKHARRDTKAGHDEIMRNNREYQTAGKSSGGYRNVGVGRREKVSSGSYQTPASPRPSASSKKPETPKDPWEGSATTPRKTTQKPGPTGRTSTVSAKPLSKEQEQAIKRATRRNPNLSKSDADRIAASVPSKESKAEELRKRMAAAAEKRGFDESYEILEKAESKQQQKIFGLALSVKRGETPRSEVSPQVLKMVDGMTEKQIRDFAKTKHKGLPKKKVDTNESLVSQILDEFSFLDEAKLPRGQRKPKRGLRQSKTLKLTDCDDCTHDQRHPDAAKIHVVNPKGERTQTLTPSEFAKQSKPPEGHKYDFGEFSKTKIVKDTTKPNRRVVNYLNREDYSLIDERIRRYPQQKAITARGPMDNNREFVNDMRTRIGVKNLSKVHFVGDIPNKSGPARKSLTAKHVVSKTPGLKNIEFVDDHTGKHGKPGNVDAVVDTLAKPGKTVRGKVKRTRATGPKVKGFLARPAKRDKGTVKKGEVVPVRLGGEGREGNRGIRLNIDAPKTPQQKQRARKKARRGMKEAVDTTATPVENKTKQNSQMNKTDRLQDRMRQQEIQIMQRKLQALKTAPKGTDPSITT